MIVHDVKEGVASNASVNNNGEESGLAGLIESKSTAGPASCVFKSSGGNLIQAQENNKMLSVAKFKEGIDAGTIPFDILSYLTDEENKIKAIISQVEAGDAAAIQTFLNNDGLGLYDIIAVFLNPQHVVTSGDVLAQEILKVANRTENHLIQEVLKLYPDTQASLAALNNELTTFQTHLNTLYNADVNTRQSFLTDLKNNLSEISKLKAELGGQQAAINPQQMINILKKIAFSQTAYADAGLIFTILEALFCVFCWSSIL